jgi:two-component system KDP operon response regulator KdpE
MRVLVIEDNSEIAENISLCISLAWSEASVILADDGDKGIELIETESPDVVILNLELRGADSFRVLEEIRVFSDVAIIVLDSKATEMDKVKGLEMGADDYVNIPFSPIDLIARMKAVLRRATIPQLRDSHRSTFVSGNLTVNFATRDVFVSGELVRLTPIEYELLCNLIRNEGKVLSHRFLLEKTWGSDYSDDVGSLKKYIYRLRVKLKDHENTQPMLLTHRGIGYKFLKPR